MEDKIKYYKSRIEYFDDVLSAMEIKQKKLEELLEDGFDSSLYNELNYIQQTKKHFEMQKYAFSVALKKLEDE